MMFWCLRMRPAWGFKQIFVCKSQVFVHSKRITAAKSWKQFRCPSMEEQVSHRVEYYSPMEKTKAENTG